MNVTIEGNSINTLSGWGIRVDGGSNNEIRFMTVTHTGLANPASKDTAILFGLPGNPWLTGVTGDAVGGVLLNNTSNNYVHDDLLNEDGYVGIELVNSKANTLDKINVRYPDYFGAYLQGSSNNTLTNVSLQTADFDGLLVRESNNNTIKFNTFSANGPIGNEWAAGIVPYFVAGAYVGWGSGGNIIEANNGNFGNTGPDLELDNGSVPTPTASVQGGVIQSLNPLNTSTGGDPGGSVVFGSSNVVCGNSSATLGRTGCRLPSCMVRPSAPTMTGSNSEPAPAITCLSASAELCRLVSRPALNASKTSTTRRMREATGMLFSLSPSGVPAPSQRSL